MNPYESPTTGKPKESGFMKWFKESGAFLLFSVVCIVGAYFLGASVGYYGAIQDLDRGEYPAQKYRPIHHSFGRAK